jgi:hypothetical protein
MILLSKNGKLFRCMAACLADLNDQRQADVGTKTDVLAFLKEHADQRFLLICQGEPIHEAAPSDEPDAVLCGVVQWNSIEQTLYNKPLTFQIE